MGGKYLPKGARVADVPLLQFTGHGLRVSGGQVVENHHIVAVFQEVTHAVGADVAGTSHHKKGVGHVPETELPVPPCQAVGFAVPN
jgi:hypothetical protein